MEIQYRLNTKKMGAFEVSKKRIDSKQTAIYPAELKHFLPFDRVFSHCASPLTELLLTLPSFSETQLWSGFRLDRRNRVAERKSALPAGGSGFAAAGRSGAVEGRSVDLSAASAGCVCAAASQESYFGDRYVAAANPLGENTMRLVCLLAAACLLAACGLKGPLVMPQKAPAPQAEKKVQP